MLLSSVSSTTHLSLDKAESVVGVATLASMGVSRFVLPLLGARFRAVAGLVSIGTAALGSTTMGLSMVNATRGLLRDPNGRDVLKLTQSVLGLGALGFAFKRMALMAKNIPAALTTREAAVTGASLALDMGDWSAHLYRDVFKQQDYSFSNLTTSLAGLAMIVLFNKDIHTRDHIVHLARRFSLISPQPATAVANGPTIRSHQLARLDELDPPQPPDSGNARKPYADQAREFGRPGSRVEPDPELDWSAQLKRKQYLLHAPVIRALFDQAPQILTRFNAESRLLGGSKGSFESFKDLTDTFSLDLSACLQQISMRPEIFRDEYGLDLRQFTDFQSGRVGQGIRTATLASKLYLEKVARLVWQDPGLAATKENFLYIARQGYPYIMRLAMMHLYDFTHIHKSFDRYLELDNRRLKFNFRAMMATIPHGKPPPSESPHMGCPAGIAFKQQDGSGYQSAIKKYWDWMMGLVEEMPEEALFQTVVAIPVPSKVRKPLGPEARRFGGPDSQVEPDPTLHETALTRKADYLRYAAIIRVVMDKAWELSRARKFSELNPHQTSVSMSGSDVKFGTIRALTDAFGKELIWCADEVFGDHAMLRREYGYDPAKFDEMRSSRIHDGLITATSVSHRYLTAVARLVKQDADLPTTKESFLQIAQQGYPALMRIAMLHLHDFARIHERFDDYIKLVTRDGHQKLVFNFNEMMAKNPRGNSDPTQSPRFGCPAHVAFEQKDGSGYQSALKKYWDWLMELVGDMDEAALFRPSD